MATKLGPVMGFRGAIKGVWNVSVLVAVDAKNAPKLTLNTNEAPEPKVEKIGTVRAGRADLTVWRFDCAIKQSSKELAAKYSVDGEEWTFTVPPLNVAPRMAYGSCNGFSSLKLLKSTRDPHALWRDVLEKHAGTPFHLLLLGGDQVYSDGIWEELRPLADWAALKTEEGIECKPSQALVRQIKEYYEELYPRRWMQTDLRKAFATIPTVMMWDDHDIFDGWGSYAKELQECYVYKALFAAARDAFALYQHQVGAAERHPLAIPGQDYFSLGFQVGSTAILVPDMRSERREDQVMSPPTWKAVYEWLDQLPDAEKPGGAKHLFVMSSIPVVYPDFQLLENALGLFPGRQELEDDLRDHWTSLPHRQERLRLIHRLLAFSEAKQCRVTILSGDVHVGAVGVVRSERSSSTSVAVKTMNQLTSSGIVHPAPPGMVLFFLENVADKISNDDSGVSSQLIEIPGTHYHFLGSRNWLALHPGQEMRYWANWHVETEKFPYIKVVHPANFEMPAPKLSNEAIVATPSSG